MCSLGSSIDQEYRETGKCPKIAYRIAYKLWSSKFTPYSSYNLPSLANCRIYLKLLLTYKRFHGFFYCPSSLFLFRANPNLRTSHNKQLIAMFSRTNSTFHSFFIPL